MKTEPPIPSLLACPFCGGKAELIHPEGCWNVVLCTGCRICTGNRNQDYKAIEQWNTRAHPTPELAHSSLDGCVGHLRQIRDQYRRLYDESKEAGDNTGMLCWNNRALGIEDALHVVFRLYQPTKQTPDRVGLIEKLEALNKDVPWHIDEIIAIVRQYEAEVIVENDRVCIAGKWFVPAVGTGGPVQRRESSVIGDAATRKGAERYGHGPEVCVSNPSPVRREIPVMVPSEDVLRGQLSDGFARAFRNSGDFVTVALDILRPYLATREPVTFSLEKCAKAIQERYWNGDIAITISDARELAPSLPKPS